MSGAIRVLLPPTAARLADLVRTVGCTAVIDATGDQVPEVPAGAWVRTRPGRPAPGAGPVVLAELGAPVPGRETWLETASARDVPHGFAGLVLKGREAGGWCGEQDGLVALADCPDPSRVILDAGVGPRTAAAAAALGAAGVLLVEPHLGCPELALPQGLERRLHLPDDEITRVVAGLRVCASPTAPVLRRLIAGDDPWALQDELWATGDPSRVLWLAGQGLALARPLAERYGTLPALLAAYVEAWGSWRERTRAARAIREARPVGTAAQLAASGTFAGAGLTVGSGVLWEEAAWLGRPVGGGPLRAAAAIGGEVVADPAELAAAGAERAEGRGQRAEGKGDSATVPNARGAVAIVGIGCRFPGGSNDPESFWNNVVGKRSAIGLVPKERWDSDLFWDPNEAAPDKTYARIGGFLDGYTFDPKAFRIPPNVARQVDVVQQITLNCVADALHDAGLKVDRKADGRAFDRERCAVILGNSLGGEKTDQYAIRLAWPDVARKLVAVPPFCDLDEAERLRFLGQMEEAYKAGLPIVDEDSMPGELANVIAGRIANAFDLGGANFTVDAACASSMAAIQAAVKSLQDFESDIVLSGGADRSMNIATYVKFSKIGALSPDHSAPFDESANGFVMGEGCGILVLKRHEDALRDGDRIYAVVRGIGGSSDGRGKGITAPNLQGQVRALQRAYESAGLDPWDVDLIEAHGTSTAVGDKVEVEALAAVIGSGHREGRGPVRIGSVKSMIGHLKSAAGAASVIKTALALHHGVLPPTLNFRQARADVPFDVVPLKVQTEPEPWPETPDGVRRAGVSAFGFGGTNFHVVLESAGGTALPVSRPAAPPPRTIAQPAHQPVAQAAVTVSSPPPPPTPGLPDGLWATSGLDDQELLANLQALADGRAAPFHPSAPLRVAGAPTDAAERREQIGRAIASLKKKGNPDLLRARGVAWEDVPFDGKLAFLFTGQGSQHLDMGLDLAETWPIVRDTFSEADRILTGPLGKPISSFIRQTPDADAAAMEDVLRRTEISQPATLTIDVAIHRLLVAYGAMPDVVAGHSLGEYGAAVAAGVMTFEQSLLAVSARGREMAAIRIDDPGKMAGIAAPSRVVDEVLAEVDGYVIAANKNCPTQTVIAGGSDAVDEACEQFKARGITVYLLPVSHAFHSAIVAPASEPLRAVLGRLGLSEPKRPITTNVTGEYYPTGPGSVDKIIDLLARQISAPVEWTAQMERMYADGARVFVEVGPKRALSGFTVAILKRRPHRAIYTNHPKRGGVASFRDALAQLLALGVPLHAEPVATDKIDLLARGEPRRATTQALTAYTELHPTSSEPTTDVTDGILRIVARASGYAIEDLDPGYDLEGDLGIDTVKQAEVFAVVRDTYGIPPDPSFDLSAHRTIRSLVDWVATRTGARRISVDQPRPAAPPQRTPTPTPAARVAAPPAAAPIAQSDVVVAFLEQAAKAGMKGLDADAFAKALLPSVQALLASAFEAARANAEAPKPAVEIPKGAPVRAVTARLPGQPWPADVGVTVVCSGTAIGLPGGDEVFGADNFVAMLAGKNRISHVGKRTSAFLDLGLVRLVKDPRTGQGSFLPVTKDEEVIRLAGTEARFDLREWGIDQHLVDALDVSTRLAFAAGLEALRDAGIPLVRTYKTTTSGKRVPQGWALPEPLRDGTGVVFGSAFPGYDALVRHLAAGGRDAEGRFDRRFLFQVLAMGHSQFAQLVGARGPNTCVNAACASSTQAMAIAEDWIRLGRCERVIVLGADDVTSDALLPWIGAGFMAAGAASTHDVVEETALPFDRRRHGLVLGMGAVGLVMESAASCAARGVVPLAEQLGVQIVNSAFHGTRLDVEHIAGVTKALVEDVCRSEGITATELAENSFFMSHETYTPARGGSAAAEIEALRAAFGNAASRIVVTNTKGFTGHPMGAGIEDGVVLKALQYGIVPPVANLVEPDEQLGDLTLSRGERRPFKYGIRLAAGFGSQLAITVHKAIAQGDHRVADTARRTAWLREMTGYAHVAEVVEERTLRVLPSDTDKISDLAPDISPATLLGIVPEAPRRAPAPAPAPASASAPAPTRNTTPVPARTASMGPLSHTTVVAELLGLVAGKTGYDPSEIEPDFELEADLGVDTVKQAEILGEVTERYGIQRDENFRIADYPTISALASYIVGASVSDPVPAPAVDPVPLPLPVPLPATTTPAPVVTRSISSSSTLDDLTALIAEKTGYQPSELEPGFELEADLGIDTVKQAEILGEILERYGLQRDDTFRLSDYPTLLALASWLDARRGMAPTASPAPPRATVPLRDAAPTPDTALAAPTPVRQLAPAPGADYASTLVALLDVVADKTGYDVSDLDPSFALEADLGVDTVKQAEILSVLQERFGIAPDADLRLADVDTLEKLARVLHQRRTGAGGHEDAATQPPSRSAPPRSASPGQVPLPPQFRVRRLVLEPAPIEPITPIGGTKVEVLGDGPDAKAIRKEVERRGGVLKPPGDVVIDAGNDVFASFAHARSRKAPPNAWLTVTRLGGVAGAPFGIERGFTDGARAGFTKSLRREWDGIAAVVADVAPEVDRGKMAVAVCDEIGRTSFAEVFVGADGVRRTTRLRDEDPPEPVPLAGAPVVLLTGGGRGITARVAEVLARRGRVKLALVGRGSVPPAPFDEKIEKERVRAEMKGRKERVTPAKIETVLEPLRRGDEVRRTIEKLRGLGATVTYMAADLADPDEARRVVGDVTAELGPIDVLVHGAGVEESRLIADKDVAAFHRVFDGKAVGGRALLEAIPANAFAVSMGSVAGRFGNPGQVDYAAANDALARMCHTRPNSLHVAWTAWDDVGMAVRGGMRSLLSDRGVDLLPAEAGASLLTDLVGARVTGEIVVAGALGDFEKTSAPLRSHPLLDSLEIEGGRARGTRALSRASDPWLLDHAIDGVPVLPGVVGLEMMAAVAGALFPERSFTGARAVSFTAPLKVHRNDTTLVLVEAEAVPDRPDEAEVRLVSVRSLKAGRSKRTPHFTATVSFGPAAAIESLPSAFLPDEVVPAEGIYRVFFHGPAFQVITTVLGVSADGLVGEAVVRHAPLGGDGLRTAPLVLEAAFQAAGLHRILTAHQMELPLSLDHVRLLTVPADGERLSVTVQQVGPRYHIDVDGVGGPVLRARGFAMVAKGPVPPDLRFPEPDGGRPTCFPASRWRRADADPPIAEASAEDDPRPWLTDAELGELRVRGTEKRVRDRVAGRIAAKRALAALTGVDPLRIRVWSAESGEPLAEVAGHPGARVSISHKDGRAVAAAVEDGGIGIDLERVERRDAPFARTWFDDAERAIIGGDPMRETVGWAVKEAVLKLVGAGMACSPHDVRLLAIGDGSAEVELRGEVAARHAARGGGEVRVRWVGTDEVVVLVRSAA